MESGSKFKAKVLKRDSLGYALGKSYQTDEFTSDEDVDTDEEPIPMEMDLTAHGPPPPVDDEPAPQGPETLNQKVTRYAKMILPHIGLVVLLGVYTVCGAGVFHLLELPNEIKVSEAQLSEIYNIREKFVQNLWNMSMNGSTDINDWHAESKTYFDNLAAKTFQAYRFQFLTAKEIWNHSHSQRWTFGQSIFFATTVITTIGYGNMVPMTVYGRIFCIVFGLFGIPLLLVTIADIGKFLSDFLSFLYRMYRRFTRKVRSLKKHSRKLSSRMSRSSRSSSRSSPEKSASPGLPPVDESETESSDDELRIPVVMVMLVLVGYTALGGLLLRMWEGWHYFDAFYFCFITMATIGFGDFVPTKQVYMFFTMAYIVVGLALATMCIDLAGTEYIRKIHYVGHKIESAKEMVGAGLVSGLHVGEHLLKHTGYGFIRTAGGKIIHASVLHRKRYGDQYIDDAYITERNILYAPLSPAVLKHVKAHIKVHPEEINEKDAYILHNKVFNQPPQRKAFHFSPEAIQRRFYRAGALPRRYGSEPVLLVAPFVLKESNV